MTEIVVEERHQVERLNNVGAIGAREGNVRFDVNGTAQPSNPLLGCGVGQTALAVRIEHREDQGRKLVTSRDATKTNPDGARVLQQLKPNLIRRLPFLA
jgi:hypothetical protein